MMKRLIEFFLSAILSFILTISAEPSQAGFLGVFAKSDLEKCEDSQSFSELKLGHHQALTGPRQDKNFGQMEPVQNILKGPIRKAANRTGMLRICREGGEVDACTATLLNDHLLLTNAHCLEATQRSGRAIGMYLFLGYEKYADYSDRPRYDVRIEPVEIGSSKDLDYAILELEKPVPNIAPLKASVRDPEAGETMTIVSHALGGIMRVTRGGCVADAGRPVVGLNVLHWCDTRAGSSGALGFADEDRALLFLHASGDAAEDIRDRGPNQGIRMTALLKQSDILRQMFTPKPADPCEDLKLGSGLSCEAIDGRAVVTNNLILEPVIEAPVVQIEEPIIEAPIFVGIDEEIRFLRDNCDRGNAEACSDLSTILRFEEGGVGPEVIDASDKSCHLGVVDECTFLHFIFEDEWWKKSNEFYDERALDYIVIGCRKGDEFSCEKLWSLFEENLVMPTREEAIEFSGIFSSACSQGEQFSCEVKSKLVAGIEAHK
ncbi:trypsin-like serine peptidase [Donghicola eburneus]|uniref:trypsin-like serine peptidase n=1 Tax=Donghicola eburneus TaxID=393278 RepID=UPI0008EA9C66|nr:trypsin-like peptidase domain-containing protein [Donghicola eburneus]SFQ66360.1 Trypsin-like peptidase domain-containing protein [Donghicola eburneus]